MLRLRSSIATDPPKNSASSFASAKSGSAPRSCGPASGASASPRRCVSWASRRRQLDPVGDPEHGESRGLRDRRERGNPVGAALHREPRRSVLGRVGGDGREARGAERGGRGREQQHARGIRDLVGDVEELGAGDGRVRGWRSDRGDRARSELVDEFGERHAEAAEAAAPTLEKCHHACAKDMPDLQPTGRRDLPRLASGGGDDASPRRRNDDCDPARTRGTRLGELWRILPEEATASDDGVLEIGGVAVTELAERFGTPLHVYDEAGLRRQIRRFVDGLRHRWPNSEVLFASKSLPAVGMYRIAQEEGLSVDIAGGGELQLALAAGRRPGAAPLPRQRQDRRGTADGARRGHRHDHRRQRRRARSPRAAARASAEAAVRVIPGVEAKTHASQATGGVHSKFGLPIDQAERAIARMQAHPLMRFEGVHLHIGSQILDTAQFAEAVAKISTVGTFGTYDVGGGARHQLHLRRGGAERRVVPRRDRRGREERTCRPTPGS